MMNFPQSGPAWRQPWPKIAAWFRGAAAACVFALGNSVPALTQNAPLSNTTLEQMQEMVRRGEAGESENGFCATLPWPVQSSLDPFFVFLERGERGGVYLAKLQTGNVRGCSYYRMDAIFDEAGKKCARTVGWACNEGDKCVVSRAIWCRNPNGSWSWRN